MSFLNILLEKLRPRRGKLRRYPLHSARLPDVILQGEPEASSLQNQASEIFRRWTTLSQREQEVAALICIGFSNREIAEKLVISPDTVKTHLKNILYKFDLHRKDDLRILLIDWDLESYG